MRAAVAILLPSYNRPDSVARVAQSLRAATPGEGVDWRMYVIAEEDDDATLQTAMSNSIPLLLNDRRRSYAGAITTGYQATDEPFLFMGADDLAFRAGWLQTAMGEFGNPRVQVVGTNDLLNPYVAEGIHATHYLARRAYLDDPGGCVDGPATVLHEGYDHNWTDTEFIGTARARGVFQPCLTSVVEHLHYSAGRSPLDATYDKGQARYDEDRDRFESRRPLWEAAQ